MTGCELGNFLFIGAFAFGSSTACFLKQLLLTANLAALQSFMFREKLVPLSLMDICVGLGLRVEGKL